MNFVFFTVRVNGTVLDNGGGGCPSNYHWCHTSPKLPFPQLITGILLINTGYPLTVVMINVLYSKVIGPFPQVSFSLIHYFCKYLFFFQSKW